MKTILETKRLIVRAFNLNDFEAVFEFGSNKEVNKCNVYQYRFYYYATIFFNKKIHFLIFQQ